ncbi:S24 family peptidase [Mesorhizobium sp. KR9-304]|uniref:S24 family peptidase n=1 Tax=Mesorhizobium sp. KR9-304 TaxID=3156614 RepID=UPI0032B47E7A
MATDFQLRLRKLMAERGTSGRKLSIAAGLHPDTVGKMLKPDAGLPRGGNLAAIADALGTTEAFLLRGEDVPLAPRKTEVRLAPVLLPSAASMPNDVPVLGTAAGSHARGAFQISTDPVDWVRRPPGLSSARNAYALYVEGTSMVPEHNPGDLRFIHPDRPARPGDSVVVQILADPADGQEATIGRLIKRTPTHLVIGKLNPAATVELKLITVVAVHKVMTLNELFGV